jgi:hypothetical protein
VYEGNSEEVEVVSDDLSLNLFALDTKRILSQSKKAMVM